MYHGCSNTIRDGILEDEHAESALVLDTNPPGTGIACRQKGWPARCFVPVGMRVYITGDTGDRE